jgi:hypothetical protein
MEPLPPINSVQYLDRINQSILASPNKKAGRLALLRNMRAEYSSYYVLSWSGRMSGGLVPFGACSLLL